MWDFSLLSCKGDNTFGDTYSRNMKAFTEEIYCQAREFRLISSWESTTLQIKLRHVFG